MSIYSNNNYRKIYEQHYGPIPKDDNGRSYEIHHIDGNHYNNDISNLKCVSIQEHYNIHYSQGDYKACLLISRAMTISLEEKSKLASLAAKKAIDNGTHHFLGENNPSKRRINDGSHQFLNSDWQKEKSRISVERGTHNFIGGRIQHERLENGSHHFLGENNPSVVASKNKTHRWLGGDHQRAMNKKLLEAGTHSTQWKWKCDCGKEGKGKSNLVQHQRSKKCLLNKF